jgi:hypothetical protein
MGRGIGSWPVETLRDMQSCCYLKLCILNARREGGSFLAHDGAGTWSQAYFPI